MSKWLKRKKPCEVCGSKRSVYWATHDRCSWKCEREWAERQPAGAQPSEPPVPDCDL